MNPIELALRERVKELTCLYSIAQLMVREGISLGDQIQAVVRLLPPAWQYPDVTSARILLDGRTWTTEGFQQGSQSQRAAVVVEGVERGFVEVTYLRQMPDLDEGPFLKEERSLIDTIAREVALVLERRHADEERQRLSEQLRHADRLATIGQLAAGVAHELNEPLGSILGFAQLAAKCEGLPEQARSDTEKIVKAALHAREVVKKLMLFARQMPPRKTQVDLNQMVCDGLYILESRLAKGGIELARDLEAGLPSLTADPSQLLQVLVNLVVNAAQAMPDGGRLTIRTRRSGENITLLVEDTGVGMTEEVRRQVFIPFFTTKDVGEGTGLGLPVVHGIVTSHGGTVGVQSQIGVGTRFEIRLPLERTAAEEP
ncbi:MAG: PAS domain-containing sensor histidine kinase [Deltaproteobacteria bacterium]|nr:PAS domain-containing sensor histidine kinase [Deltaproteobacteria bacterium]